MWLVDQSACNIYHLFLTGLYVMNAMW